MPNPEGDPYPTEIDEAIENAFPRLEWGAAEAIIARESGYDAAAINNTSRPELPGYHAPRPGDLPEYSIGLFQINTLAWPDIAALYDLTDPFQNVLAAARIYAQEGWQPWGGAPSTGQPSTATSTGQPSTATATGQPSPATGQSSATTGAGDTSLPGGASTQAGVLAQIGQAFATLSALIGYLEVNAGVIILRIFLVLAGAVMVIIGLYYLLGSLAS